MAKIAANTDGILLSAPQYAMVSVPGHISIDAPAGVSVVAAQWDFGDGTAPVQGAGPFDHIFFNVGTTNVSVVLTDSLGTQMTLTKPINIIGYSEAFLCISDLSLTAGSTATTGQPMTMNVNIPGCLTSTVTAIKWNYGDASTIDTTSVVQHTFTAPGTYTVSTEIYISGSSTPQFTLTNEVVVTDPTPTPNPNPTPTPDPTVDPLACTTPTATRTVTGADYTESKTCGTGGTETDIYHDLITQTCKLMPGEIFQWVETSRAKQLVSAGECKGQSCVLPGGGSMADGSSQTFYSTSAPAGSCTEVSEVRTCANGVLGGTTQYTSLTCQSGCPGFGPNGSVQVGVVTGQVTVPHTCAYGETGINDIFNQISDQTCQNGTVVTSNTRQGSLISGGVCPGYVWAATDSYTACSATCGGQQTQLYVCRDGLGNVVDSSRCAGSAPVVTRVCDGDPDSVKRTETTTATEDGGSSNTCPANQIGVIIKTRTSTTVTNYACVNHSVAVASQSTTFGDWVIDNHCRDYVAYRCSQDSLDNTHAHGRYDWMVKCAKDVPAIKAFLEEMSNVKGKAGGSNYQLGDKGRVLYPTFMYRGTKCVEKSKGKEKHRHHHGDDDDDDDRDFDGNKERRHIRGEGHERGDHRKCQVGGWHGRDDDDEHIRGEGHERGDHHNCRVGRGSQESERTCTDADIPWIAPTDPKAPCTVPDGVYVSAVCVSSCATPEQLIKAQATGNGKLHDVPFFEAWQKKFAFVASLQSESSMSSKDVQKTAVEQWVTELVDTDHVILEFRMRSGGSLRLTPNHPLLGPDGIMREASEFKVGESLLQLGAIPDQIVSIRSTNYFGKVYNVFVQSAAPHHNVVVTNGYLNGTAFFQNEGAQYLNRQVLRTRLIKGVLSK